MTIKEIRKSTGLSQKAFCEMYEIPRRTLEDWEAGRREPPAYVLKMLSRIVTEDFDTSGTTD